MGFKTDAFQAAKLVHRTADVPVPGLADWFEVTPEQQAELDKITDKTAREKYLVETVGCVWKVRGMTDDELQRNAEQANGQRLKLAEAFATMMDAKSEVDEIIEQMGGKGVTFASALRMENVRSGSVEPKINQATAVRLSKAFPVEFRMIENKIMELTGLGQVTEKKSKPSGEVMKSKAA
jgi:hypothetical protein